MSFSSFVSFCVCFGGACVLVYWEFVGHALEVSSSSIRGGCMEEVVGFRVSFQFRGRCGWLGEWAVHGGGKWEIVLGVGVVRPFRGLEFQGWEVDK